MSQGMVSEFRRDKATNRWCIIAPGRWTRPTDLPNKENAATQREPLEERIRKCPFCPGNEDKTPKPTILQYPKNQGWSIRVCPNKHPAVVIEGVPEGEPVLQQKSGVQRKMPGFGAHEVIIDTPRHGEIFAEFSPEQANDLFWAFRERILDLRKDKRLQYILIFKNEGKAAGASLEHSHCQLIGSPVVPPLINHEVGEAEAYYDDQGTCVYCDMLNDELRADERVFFENDYAVAITPYASRSPFEIWVVSKEHISRYEESAPRYIQGVAEVMNQTAKRLSCVLKRPAYNFYLHNGPLIRADKESNFHHHFEIVPRITTTGGFEWGTGLYINVVAPEEAAKMLKETKLE